MGTLLSSAKLELVQVEREVSGIAIPNTDGFARFVSNISGHSFIRRLEVGAINEYTDELSSELIWPKSLVKPVTAEIKGGSPFQSVEMAYRPSAELVEREGHPQI